MPEIPANSMEHLECDLRDTSDDPVSPARRCHISMTPDKAAIEILVKGYGVHTMADGYGPIAFLEFYEGKLRMHVWADINQEDPTHTIELEGAREDRRQPPSLQVGDKLEVIETDGGSVMLKDDRGQCYELPVSVADEDGAEDVVPGRGRVT